MDTYEIFSEIVKQAEDAFLLLSQAFEKLVNVMCNNMKEVLEKMEDCERKRGPKTPKEYGISLLEKRKKLLLKRYSYIPIPRKYLPYQRRTY